MATACTIQTQIQTPPDNEIWYTTTDGKIAELYDSGAPSSGNGEDFEIVSHFYRNGKGVIRANKPIKAYGGWYRECVNTEFYFGVMLRGNIESVILPKGVTIIRSDAFKDCSSLKSITIPDGVTSIRYHAFNGCSSLTSITIPDGVTAIGDYAFRGCSSLTSITIPDSVTTIGRCAFYNCSSLTSITIPNSVTTIGEYAFDGCSSLPVIDNIRYVGTCLVEVVDKSQTSYTIKEGTRIIGNRTFEDCSSLKSITIPNSVTSIGYEAFYGCSSLTSITIPDSVTMIGNYAFYECNKLAKIVCLATEPPQIVCDWSDVYLGISEATKIYVPKESVKAYKQDEYWGRFAEQIVPIK